MSSHTNRYCLQIDDGALLELDNELGKVTLPAKLSNSVAPGVLYSRKGTWLGTNDSGCTVNALIDAILKTGTFDGAYYIESFVDIIPLSPQFG